MKILLLLLFLFCIFISIIGFLLSRKFIIGIIIVIIIFNLMKKKQK